MEKKGKKRKECQNNAQKTMCTHSKWANTQTLKTDLHISLHLKMACKVPSGI